jgi:hypothetical protein
MSNVLFAISKREIWVLVGALVLLAAFALRPSIRGNDGVGHYVYLASLLADGDLDLTNNYEIADNYYHYDYKFSALARDAQTGLPSNRYGIGSALLWLPFVGAVHAVLGSPAEGMYARPYVWAVGIGTVFWTYLGLILLYLRLRRSFGPAACGWTLAGLLLATPLGFYTFAHGSMSHGISFLAVTGLLLATERVWQTPTMGRCAEAGGWLALALITRFQDATWVAICGLICLIAILKQSKSKRCRLGLLALAVTGVLILLPQWMVWQTLYGSWLSGPTPYLNNDAGEFLGPRYAWAALFSGRRGALIWHPLLAMGMIGLIMLTFKKPATPWRNWALVGLLGLVLQALLIGSWSMWYGGASFGNRFFISALPALAIGVAWVLERPKPWLWRGLMLFLIAWNAGLLIQYALELFPREGNLPFGQVIRQNVIEVPRLLLRHLHS